MNQLDYRAGVIVLHLSEPPRGPMLLKRISLLSATPRPDGGAWVQTTAGGTYAVAETVEEIAAIITTNLPPRRSVAEPDGTGETS